MVPKPFEELFFVYLAGRHAHYDPVTILVAGV
jgi:hypothetical protein